MTTFKVTIDPIGEKILIEERNYYHHATVEYSLDLKENLIRDALIKLGWTPPGEKDAFSE